MEIQGCHKDFKLPGKYNQQAGNQTARDFFSFYFCSIFQKKQLGATHLAAGENPWPPALNDNPGDNRQVQKDCFCYYNGIDKIII